MTNLSRPHNSRSGRTMSSDGTHTIINSLDRFAETNATGRITPFKVAS